MGSFSAHSYVRKGVKKHSPIIQFYRPLDHGFMNCKNVPVSISCTKQATDSDSLSISKTRNTDRERDKDRESVSRLIRYFIGCK